MNRSVASFLVIVFLALGSGAAEYVHNLQHTADDRREDAAASVTGEPTHPLHHDDSNCAIHAQLHLPFAVIGWIPILISLGLLIAFLTQFATTPVPRLSTLRVDCRGPPVIIPA